MRQTLNLWRQMEGSGTDLGSDSCYIMTAMVKPSKEGRGFPLHTTSLWISTMMSFCLLVFHTISINLELILKTSRIQIPESQTTGLLQTTILMLVYLYRYDKFYFSANASNLLDKDLTKFNPVSEPNALRNYYLYTGYRYTKNKNSKLEIEPSVFFQWFESDGRSVTDLNAKFRFYDFEDYYYVGVTYRFLNDQIGSPLYIAPLIGLKKSNFYFGYSYQIILNEILGFSTGTHVITIGVDLFQGLSNCRCTY